MGYVSLPEGWTKNTSFQTPQRAKNIKQKLHGLKTFIGHPVETTRIAIQFQRTHLVSFTSECFGRSSSFLERGYDPVIVSEQADGLGGQTSSLRCL